METIMENGNGNYIADALSTSSVYLHNLNLKLGGDAVRTVT